MAFNCNIKKSFQIHSELHLLNLVFSQKVNSTFIKLLKVQGIVY